MKANAENEAAPSNHDHEHKLGETCCGHDHSPDHDHAHDPDPAACAHYDEAERRFFFNIEILALIAWGAILVYYVASGKVIPFLSPVGIFREQALIGGFALLILAVFNFAMRNRFPGCGHDHEDGEHHHDDEPGWLGRTMTIFILMAPVLLAAFRAPPDWTDSFKLAQANSIAATNAPTNAGKFSAQSKDAPAGGFTLDDFKKYAPPNAEGVFQLSVSDLWSLAGDPDVRKVIEGQMVETSAQVVQDTVSKGSVNRLRVFELQMTCCAADARPVAFPIQFESKIPDFREMGWYKITGKIKFEDERSGKVTVINVTDMVPTTRPKGTGPAI